MEMGMGMYQTIGQRLERRLSHEQRMELKQLMLQMQMLRDPPRLYAAKGLEGMVAADEILKEKNRAGILIGGLAETVWNYRRKPEELAQHKDVDVMVQGDADCDFKKFEGGIDWWLPEEDDFPMYNEASGQKEPRRLKYWVNGNGVVLSFTLDRIEEYEADKYAGLLIPNVDWLVNMRSTEATAQVDEAVGLDQDVVDRFEEQVRKKMGTCLPGFLKGKFNVPAGDDLYRYSPSLFNPPLYSLSLKEKAAIRGVEDPVLH